MKKIPELPTEEAVVAFWDEHDSTEYIDWDKAQKIRPVQLQKSARTISVRMPIDMIETLKIQANKNDIPYQSYLKILIADGLKARA